MILASSCPIIVWYRGLHAPMYFTYWTGVLSVSLWWNSFRYNGLNSVSPRSMRWAGGRFIRSMYELRSHRFQRREGCRVRLTLLQTSRVSGYSDMLIPTSNRLRSSPRRWMPSYYMSTCEPVMHSDAHGQQKINIHITSARAILPRLRALTLSCTFHAWHRGPVSPCGAGFRLFWKAGDSCKIMHPMHARSI